MESFPQAQRYIPGYQDGGQGADQQQIIMQYLQFFAQLQNMKVEELIQALQQMPQEQQGKALQQIVQVVDQALAQQQGQQPGMAEQPEMAQQGEMPMDPSQAMQMAYGGASKLKKFTQKKAKGGMIEGYPAAAELPDSPVYRSFPPNIPRLFEEGGSTLPEYQILGQVNPQPAVAESTVPFGQVYNPNTGRTEYPWYTKTAGAVAGLAGLGALYKGIPYLYHGAKETAKVSPLLRPVPEGKAMADMSREAPTKRFYQQMFEEPAPTEQVTVKAGSNAEKKLLSQKSNANLLDVTRGKKGEFSTWEVPTGEATKYAKYSEYGNAKYVQDVVLPKHGISAKEWAAMGKTAEGRRLQRYIVMAESNPNLAKAVKYATKTYSKMKGMPGWAKALAAISAAGAAAGMYFYGNQYPETAESNTMQDLGPNEQAALDSLIRADSTAAVTSGNPFYLFSPARKQYGGPASFSNYGAFTVPMAYGGSTEDALPGVFDTDAYLNDYTDNNFKKYLRENVDDSIYERMMERNNQMMRRGGTSSKKKI